MLLTFEWEKFIIVNVQSNDNEVNFTAYDKNNRIEFIDAARGIAIVYVVIYHFIFDLSEYGAVDAGFLDRGIWLGIHYFFFFTLIFISGLCTAFSHDIIKRGAVLFIIGYAVTAVTEVLFPNNKIVFGILSLLGAMMIIYGVAKPAADKIKFPYMMIIWIVLFVILRDFSEQQGTVHLLFEDVKINLPQDKENLYPLGILYKGFVSADYFPIIPYGFIFLAGAAASKPVTDNKLPKLFYSAKIPVISTIGKYSLYIYLAHQPILLLILKLIYY